MINPQLLDYIHQQLSTGVSKEEISQALISNGWQVTDINDVFAIASSMPTTQLPVQASSLNFIQPAVVSAGTSHADMWAIVIVLLLLVGAGGAFAAYQAGLFASPVATTTTPTTSTVAPSTSPLANGMTRYNSGLFGVTIDYDTTKLFEHSLAGMEDGLYSVEQHKEIPGTASNPAVGSPDAYRYSAYSLTWQYYRYPGDIQQVIARECASDTYKKSETQTLVTIDGISLQGCHKATFGGTISKPAIYIAEVIYFVEQPITKGLVEFHAVENILGGGQDTEAQKLYKQGDDLIQTVSFYKPNQSGYDLLKKVGEMKDSFSKFQPK